MKPLWSPKGRLLQ